MEYITDYDLCPACQEVLSTIVSMMSEVEDIYQSDPEGPIMICYDNQLFCGGSYCEPDYNEPSGLTETNLSFMG